MAFLTHSLVPTGADCICLSDASLKREAGPQCSSQDLVARIGSR